MLEAVNAARAGRIVPQKQTNKQTNRQHDHGKDNEIRRQSKYVPPLTNGEVCVLLQHSSSS